ncbi:MAG: TonB-dependent receptor plug domain-containing protein, partial [Gemmatimonadota bacterium]|nr:TonB-dependent receptor plug domain-containing protein [Gemmatimonadota bacterium]
MAATLDRCGLGAMATLPRPSKAWACRYLRTRPALLFWTVAILFTPSSISAQTAVVSGQVAESRTGLPVADALVEHPASGARVRAGVGGRFSMELPTGPLELRFSAPGFTERTVRDTLSTGLSIDVTLSRKLFDLGEVVATVAGDRRRVELGNAVARFDATGIVDTRVVPSVSALLQSRIPGVSVQSSGGLAGAGSRVRVRGQSSLLLRNEPIVYIDGIRAEGRPAAGTSRAALDFLPISRFDDLNPDDIETLEVVRGPSAAALYGTEAGNGVIRITTRRGRPGPARFQFSTEQGLVQKAVTFG